MYKNLIPLLLAAVSLGGCNADAESPCPREIFSATIELRDSISESILTQGTVNFGMTRYLHQADGTVEEDYTELDLTYYQNKRAYSVSLDPDQERRADDIAVYAFHEGYHPAVHKEKDISSSLACTRYETVIYLCPTGTACR